MQTRMERLQKAKIKNKIIISTVLIGAGVLIIIGVSYKYLY